MNFKYNNNKNTSDFDTVIRNVEIKNNTNTTIHTNSNSNTNSKIYTNSNYSTFTNSQFLNEKENPIKFNVKGNLNFKQLVTPKREYKDYFINYLKNSEKNKAKKKEENKKNEIWKK